MRARLAIKSSGVNVALREIVLRNKPAEMLGISTKATVPVLQLPDGTVLDESWDIVHWATSIADPNNLASNSTLVEQANALIHINDHSFKQHLDHYKYADHFPEKTALEYRALGEEFLRQLETLLTTNTFLLDKNPCLADIGIFPFIRQFAHVDIDWFRQTPYPKLHAWMDYYLSSELFASIMSKYKPWSVDDTELIF
ncbi:MAG: glutathione S-transferase [Cycloclasticus sp. symbiont of Poecilosclerida sp. M]|nr:MAG: glutathione S-transferase [Cycloclasticus sp. symbiont of Poecilosclerida sp. M]